MTTPSNTTDAAQLKARFNPEGSLLRRQQHRMMELLMEIDRVCKAHGLRYWLIGGTLLGAVRHQGFIPWDDDMDIQMLREDYDRLMALLPGELPHHMALQSRDTDGNYLFQYAKLRDRRSVMEENTGYDRRFKERGIFIDIFPIDRHASWAQRLSIRSYGHVYKLLKRGAYRRAAAWVSLHEKLVFPMLHLLGHTSQDSYLDALGVPFVQVRHTADILPLTTLTFEGREMPVPGHYDRVLRNQYGDYMQLPPIESVNLHVSALTFLDEEEGQGAARQGEETKQA